MQYDPIKRSLGNVFNKSPFLRKVFYRLLDLLLLRCWHVHKELSRFTPASTAGIHSASEFPKEITPLSSGEGPGVRSGGPGLKILDAGAGFGQYTYWMHRHFRNSSILAVDVKEEQVADCNNFFSQIGATGVKFEVADLTKFVQPESVDLVLSVDVMEHILEDVQVFKNFFATMRPGAMLLISTPSDQGGSDVHGDEEASFIEEHVRDGYNINEIQDKLKSAGFTKIEARYAYGSPGKISWRLSMKIPIQVLGVSKLFFILLPFYYLVVYPFCYLLNYLDTVQSHKTGTGLIVKAWK